MVMMSNFDLKDALGLTYGTTLYVTAAYRLTDQNRHRQTDDTHRLSQTQTDTDRPRQTF